ncbi:hypothetical protein PIIN_05570 [Serendipita indica DSM 11827]|uniref:Uncharacterized protein n=1 Tax=Serendipita indica (strain DSM 11827) TaxID=1109443 RepID=G4TJY9_SERID|nr:hypothetical protein PIIN_05570 [Serendipita indica DSM 11827]
MRAHTDVCSASHARQVGQGQASTSANTFGNVYYGVYAGTSSIPSGQSPPENIAEPSYRNPVFNHQTPSGSQQHQLPGPRSGSNFGHTPSPDQHEAYDFLSQPSLSPEVSPQTSQPPYTHFQLMNSNVQPTPLLDPYNSPDHPQIHQIASPQSYEVSPVGQDPNDAWLHVPPSRLDQRMIPNDERMTTFPPPGLSQPRSTRLDARSSTASRDETTYSLRQRYAGPTNGSQSVWQTAPPVQIPLAHPSNVHGLPHDEPARRVYPQAQPGQARPSLVVYPSPGVHQPNTQLQSTLPPRQDLEPLFDLSQSRFWPGKRTGQCQC